MDEAEVVDAQMAECLGDHVRSCPLLDKRFGATPSERSCWVHSYITKPIAVAL